MATASDKYRIGILATLLSAVFMAGCVAQMPVKFRPDNAASGPDNGRQQAAATGAGRPPAAEPAPASVDHGEQVHQQLALPASEPPLPRQAYDANGGKIPYKPQPNPYTSGDTAVPTEARAMYVAASARLSEGNLSSARTRFEQLAEKYPDLSGPWVGLGKVAEREGKYEEAIGHYRKAISLNRNNVNAYIALGLAQRKHGRFSDAQDSYLAALVVWKDFPEAHLNLAILYDLYGNQAEAAQKHYEAYTFLTGGKDEKAFKWLAEVRQRTGIAQSFIDNPPIVVVPAPTGGGNDSSVAAAQGGP